MERDKGIKLIASHETVIDNNVAYASLVCRARRIANDMGFEEVEEIMIATVASELAMNIIRYAERGSVTISRVLSEDTGIEGIEIWATDSGPGIKDISAAMSDYYTTDKNSLGQGLPSVKRNMDTFKIDTVIGEGTRILTYKWKPFD